MERRTLLATAGSGLAAGFAGCNYLNTTDSSDSPLAGETVRVGVFAPLNLPHLGSSIHHGARLAAQQINNDGGIAGADIELVFRDTEASHQFAANQHDELIAEEDCDLTLGLIRDASAAEILPSVANHQTVHITTGAVFNRAGDIVADNTDEYRHYFHAGWPGHPDLSDALTTFVTEQAAERGWERIAVLTENRHSATSYHETLVTKLDEHLDVAIAERGIGLSSPAPLYNDVESEGCDLLVTGHKMAGTTLVNDWAQQERTFDLGGLHLPSLSPDYWAATDGRVESVFSLTPFTPTADPTIGTGAFARDYTAEFDQQPVYSGALTYDALRLYRQAVETAIQSDDSQLPEQETIIETLEELTFTDGVVYPDFEFTDRTTDRPHEPAWTSMTETGGTVVQQWQEDADGDGVIETIAPDDQQTAAYQPRPWLDQ